MELKLAGRFLLGVPYQGKLCYDFRVKVLTMGAECTALDVIADLGIDPNSTKAADTVQVEMAYLAQQLEIDGIPPFALTPSEIEYIAEQVRLQIAEALVAVRKLQAQDLMPDGGNPQALNTGVYTLSYQLLEQLRDLAHQVALVAVAAINRKPPLIVRRAEIDGTLQQVAYAFYGDYRRAGELLRLNPQIMQPNFIQQGDLINAYTK